MLIFGALAYLTATWVLESLARGSLACGRLELIRLEVRSLEGEGFGKEIALFRGRGG